jgi:hypothetical protein
MKEPVSPRDLDLLSAYLDGQIKPSERARLETRLEKNPDLRVVLVELERTRSLIRAVPRIRVPRNFYLTPEMVGFRGHPGVRLYPAFRLASAIASLLFVAVVVGDLFGGSIWLPAAGDQVAPRVAVLQKEETAPLEEISAAPAAEMPAPLHQEIPEEIGLEAAEPVTNSIEAEVIVEFEREQELPLRSISPTIQIEPDEFAVAMDESAVELEESAVEESTETPMMEALAPEGEAPVSEDQLPTEMALEATSEAVAVKELAQDVATEVFQENGDVTGMEVEPVEDLSQEISLDAAEDFGESQTPEVEPFVESQEEPSEITGPGWSLLRVVEVLLGIIALGTGALAFYFRRRI